MALRGSSALNQQQYHPDYRAHTGAKNFDSAENLPAEYRDLVTRMLSIQARIELEYMLAPERTLLRPMGMAPRPEDRAEYAAFWSDEVRHGSYWWRILEGLGATIDDKFMSTPMPIYLFEMRDRSEHWVEYAYFSFFGDRQGAYMGFEWVGCTYSPLARISDRVWREEVGHAAFGNTLLKRICETPEGRKAAEHYLPRWYAAGLDMFGSDSSKRQYDYIKWGLRKRSNKQMRDEFILEVNDLLAKADLPVPDAEAGRKYL
jgi:ring-1,2-phenylacetyl-CoA epoxidase subunit PaaA